MTHSGIINYMNHDFGVSASDKVCIKFRKKKFITYFTDKITHTQSVVIQ
jgi:hypothetical protein